MRLVLCLSEDSETESDSSGDDLSLLYAKQQQQQQQRQGKIIRLKRQRLGGVSLDDVTAGISDVDHNSASALLLSYRGITTSEAQGPPGLEPQSRVHADHFTDLVDVQPKNAGTAASWDRGLPASISDLGEVELEPDLQASPRPSGTVPVTSEVRVAGSAIVVHAIVEHQPSNNS